ncbi:sensor histidine kinase [Actinocorallia aurantiaca]|uniref:histidine kinase n=1 Tax=Actinocorallia aurantiaca TaxID=46204 RepID=A0ABN3UE93_9ACTN
MTSLGDTDRSRRRGLTVPSSFRLALTLLALLVLAASLGVNALLDRTADASDRLTTQIMPAHVQAAQLQAFQRDQETGFRGYVLTSDKRFLSPYTSGLEGERETLETLRELVKDEPQLRADLEQVAATAQRWREEYAEPVLARAEANGGAVEKPDTAKGKTNFDALRATWDVQNRNLTRTQTEARSDLADTRQLRDWLLLAMLAVFLIVGVALATLLHFTVVRPLNSLRIASRRAAEGDFTHPIPSHGPVDVQDVGQAVEAMRARLVEELDAATEREKLLLKQASDLDSQATELRRSNTELEQFAYVASHDLQEPLRKVASFCQMLERRYNDQLDDRGRQYIAFATDGAKRMQILINDLLTFSRVGRMNSHRRPLELDEVLDRALTNLNSAITDTGARIERPEKLPQLTGDPTLLTMLWQNLVGNAIKFRKPDTVPEIKIECEEQEAGSWLLTVTDNGIGIPAEYSDKVFVIFQRLHSREAYSGTGIGLALCKKIIEYHDGRIWLDTDHVDGTRLHFTLTDVPENEPVAVPAAAEESVS